MTDPMSEIDPNPETVEAMRTAGVGAFSCWPAARVAEAMVAVAVAAAEERERERWEAALHRAVAEADRGARIQGEQTERKRCIAIVEQVREQFAHGFTLDVKVCQALDSVLTEIAAWREVPSTTSEPS